MKTYITEYLQLNNSLEPGDNIKVNLTIINNSRHTYTYDEIKSKKEFEDYQAKYKDFNDKFFNQFAYLHRQQLGDAE
jgi:D-alanine-D-alanine ligase-like ATP-grasp enzyme